MEILAILLLGLCFGSFVNAFVWRFHEKEQLAISSKRSVKKGKSKKLTAKELSVLKGRSMCPHCHHDLAWYDLLPVISWVALRGKCRYCSKPISWQYPIVEAATALLFAVSFIYWPYGFGVAGSMQFAIWLVMLVGLMALIVYDLRWMLLPNKIVFTLTALALVQLIPSAISSASPLEVIVSAFWGFISIGVFFYVLFQVSNGRWIGGGDVKLAFMIGILVGGPINSFMVLFLSSLLGSIVSVPLMLNKRLKISSKIPYGPFLILATIFVYLFAEQIKFWYLNSLQF